MKADPERMSRAVLALVIAVVSGVTIAVHWPAVQNGFLSGWDDNIHLEWMRAQHGLTWSSVKWAFTTAYPFSYFPLTRVLYLLQYQMWGMNPWGYHVDSVLLHGVNAGFVTVLAWMLMRTMKTFNAVERYALAAGVGLVFGVHPLQVEPVNWFAEQMTLVCGLFCIASLSAYVHYTRQAESRFWYGTVTLLFAAALLTKATAVTLPLVMLVMDYYPLNRFRELGWKSLIREKAPWFILSTWMGIVTLLTAHRAEKLIDVGSLGIVERSFVAARSCVFHFWKLLWPSWLSPLYPLEGRVSALEPEFLLSATVVGVITLWTLWNTGRARAWFAAWFSFGALILPVSGIFQSGAQAAADRYMYIAMLPILLIAASCCLWCWRRAARAMRVALASLWLGYLAFLSVTTRAQIPVWRNEQTVLEQALSCYPNSVLVNYIYTVTLVRNGQYAEAFLPAQQTVRLFPGSAEARAALGLINLKEGRYAEAEHELNTALEFNPDFTVAAYNLACVYSKTARFDEAYELLRKVFSREPSFVRTARRDDDLVDLRNHSVYGPRFRQLAGENDAPR